MGGLAGKGPRVVITGIGLATPIGHTLDAVSASLREKRHGIAFQPAWEKVGHFATRLAAPVTDLDLGSLPRKEDPHDGPAVAALGLRHRPGDRGGGPLTGAAGVRRRGARLRFDARVDYRAGAILPTIFSRDSLIGVPPTSYLKFMSHTTSANLAMYYGIRGRVISTCSACVSGSQAIGAGYEAIKQGTHDVMVCGGAEELHFTHAGVFDIMYAASTRFNDRPDSQPPPVRHEARWPRHRRGRGNGGARDL